MPIGMPGIYLLLFVCFCVSVHIHEGDLGQNYTFGKFMIVAIWTQFSTPVNNNMPVTIRGKIEIGSSL